MSQGPTSNGIEQMADGKGLVLSPEQRELAAWLWRVTEFCLERGGRWCFKRWELGKLFRYVAFCHLTGKLWVDEHGPARTITGAVFCWPAWIEHLEARAAMGLPQFEWSAMHPGDVIFVAEVLGDREAVGRLWERAWKDSPAGGFVHRFFTYRRGDLVQLDGPKLERFLRGRRS